jgi:hypothetical protein
MAVERMAGKVLAVPGLRLAACGLRKVVGFSDPAAPTGSAVAATRSPR